LAVTSKRRGATNRKAAEKRARALAATLRQLRRAGVVSLRDIAATLNERKIKTVYGGRWHATTVARLLQRLRPPEEHGRAARKRL